MKVEKINVMNIDGALRGMRNPMNSWDNSDSYVNKNGMFVIGDTDLVLATKLIKAGGEHRKFMRQIFVTMDITAPLYWWKEFDTYKVGTVANSTSTMHKIHSKPIEISDFEVDDMDEFELDGMFKTINICEFYRKTYIDTKDKKWWKALIRLLPESYLQTRTVTMNFENLLNIVRQRTGHKLTEWHTFIDRMRESVTYADKLIFPFVGDK